MFSRKVLTLLISIALVIIFIITYQLLLINENKFDYSSVKFIEFNESSAQRPRILCLVTTQPKNHNTKALAIKDTWGKRCDILYFISSQVDENLPSVQVKCSKEDHNHLWCKNRNGIIQVFHKYKQQFDWFMKADDDTYVIVDNLRSLVSHFNASDPLWFGCPFRLPGDQHRQIYMSGGAGYVISREAMNRLIDAWNASKLCNSSGETGADDVEIGRCLEKLGVKMGDSRDELKRKRFFPFTPWAWLNPYVSVYSTTNWFRPYSVYKYTQGLNCCSNTTITFHYVSREDMYVYDFFVYHLKHK